MKKILLPFLLLFSFTTLFAQPSNDDCGNLIDLGVIPFCPDDVWYTNVDATETDIGDNNFPTGCDGGDITFSGRDVFFKFTTGTDLLDINVTVTGSADPGGSTPMSNPQVAVFRGECLVDELSLLKCGKAEDGSNIISIDVFGLDPNTEYFIRINDWSPTAAPNWGTFQLCIGEQDPEFTVCDDLSVASEGVLFDCGGEDGDYENNSTESFTICPDQLTAIDGCIIFSMEFFNLELGGFFGDADYITFYDGPDTNSPIISNIGNNGIGDDGGGGVCYIAQASSGCMTVEMVTNGSVVFEGFAGSWVTTTDACVPVVPIDVTADPTDEELADFVTTPQSFATITNVDCASGQYGTFTAEGSGLGLEKGILLTTGQVNIAVGPDDSNSAGFSNGGDGDDDLDELSGVTTNDACVVELDVFVATNQLKFEYVFGSEEYPEFVDGTVNDAFALMVSGPGIVGDPALNDQQNIAVVPGTTTPVTINDVNNLTNYEYYRYNEAGQAIQYDGLTSDFLGVKKSLTATLPVIPCTTYHLKFAIADGGDFIYDSGVFIGELEGDVPDLSVNFASGVDYLIEDCTGTQDELIITLENPQAEDLTYDVTISGTATLGVDYTLDIPAQITVPAGITELNYPLIPLTDALTEGIETITIQLTSNFGCGDVELNIIEIELHDVPLVEVFAGVDTAFVCSGTCIQMEVNGAATYEWVSEFPGVFDDPTSDAPIACPTQSQWVSVTGTVSALPGCNDVDSVYLQFVDPTVEIVALDPINICAGDSVRLQAANNVNNTGLLWTPDDFISSDTDQNVTVEPPFTQTYTASVTVSGCTVTDEITINVNAYDPPILTTTDTLLCQGSVLQLADSLETTTTIYNWTPEDFIITDTDISGAVAIPQEDIVYQLISNSQDDFCRDTFEVNVTVLPAEIEIDNGDYLELCLGDSVLLTTTNSTNGVGIEWTPDNGTLSTLEGPDTWATPVVTTTYFATLTVGQCVVTDSIQIRVDSLPEMGISAIPARSVYCLGEVVNLVSPTYVDENFPDIMHSWNPVIGQNSDTTNYNLNFSAVESFTYTRVTTNRACSETNTIFIDVIDPNDIIMSPTDTVVCSNQEVTVSASTTISQIDGWTWTTDSGADSSCGDDECLSTVITVLSGNNTVTAEAEVEGCPVMASVVLIGVPDPTFSFPEPPQVCEGESIVLNGGPLLNNAVYQWSTDAGPLAPDPNAQQPEVAPNVTTTYYLEIENEWCPARFDSVTINVAGLSTLTIPGDQALCENDFVNFEANSNNLGTFTWSTGQVVENTFDGSVNFSAAVLGNQTIYVTYNNDCPDTPLQDSFNVQVSSAIDADEMNLTFEPSFIDSIGECWFNEGEAVTVSYDGEGNPVSYDWVYADSTISTGNSALFQALTIGNLDLEIISPEGCPTLIRKPINIVPAIWVMPNAFTPNGDGQNDFFTPLIKGSMSIITFQVYNRFGNRVYNNGNGLNGWNGQHKGKASPMDSYIYKLELLRPDGVTVEKKEGDVMLIR
ncbi:MAG: choice-of-anchor L domain-containing protein [Saprospiraceae bacterium]